MLQPIIKLRSAFGERIKQRIEDSLRQYIEILLEELLAFGLVIHSDEKVDKVLGDPLVQDPFILLKVFLIRQKELHGGEPEEITDDHLVLLNFENLQPFFKTAVQILGILEKGECFHDILDHSGEIHRLGQRTVQLIVSKLEPNYTGSLTSSTR